LPALRRRPLWLNLLSEEVQELKTKTKVSSRRFVLVKTALPAQHTLLGCPTKP
jgi:hypothetical protein